MEHENNYTTCYQGALVIKFGDTSKDYCCLTMV